MAFFDSRNQRLHGGWLVAHGLKIGYYFEVRHVCPFL